MKKHIGKLFVLTLVFSLLFAMQSYAGWVGLGLKTREAQEGKEAFEQTREEREAREQYEKTAAETKASEANTSAAGSSAMEENIIKATIDGKEEIFYVVVTENNAKGGYYYFHGLSLTSSGTLGKSLSFGVNPNVQTGKTAEFDVIYYRPDYSLDEQYSKKSKQKAVYTLTVNEENGTHLEGTFEADLKTGSRHGYAVIPISGSFNLNYGQQVDSVKELYDIAKGRGSSSGSAASGSPAISGNVDTGTTRKETVDHTCRTCGGTGRCYICGGDGLNRLGSDEGKVHKCHTCHGTGTCQVCYGSGVVR